MDEILHDIYLFLRFRKDKYNIKFIEYVERDEINRFEGVHVIQELPNLEQDVRREFMIEKVI